MALALAAPGAAHASIGCAVLALLAAAEGAVDGKDDARDFLAVALDLPTGRNELAGITALGEAPAGISANPSVSADGRFVAFDTTATDILPGLTTRRQVYVRDRALDITRIVSVASDGTPSNFGAQTADISANGRYVAFNSSSSNLVLPDGNFFQEIYVHDLDALTTVRVSITSDAVQASGRSHNPSISSDGRFVAFASESTDLVAGDTNGVRDIFVHDRDFDEDGDFDEPEAVATVRVSVAADGTEAESRCDMGPDAISDDGRFVVFWSLAANLVPDDTNGTFDVFLHDRDSDGDGVFDEPGEIATIRMGEPAAETGQPTMDAAISADGRYVAFVSNQQMLVPGDTNGWQDLFVWDRAADAISRVSVASDGTQASSFTRDIGMSRTGRYVVFYSNADNLVPGDTFGLDVFIHDRDADADGLFDEPGAVETRMASVAADGGFPNAESNPEFDEGRPAVSENGRLVTFESDATNLVTFDDNGRPDVFVRDRGDPGLAARCPL